MKMRCVIASLLAVPLFACAAPPARAAAVAAASTAMQAVKRMYVFGNSYSDIGEGYLDGNGPTAVAYLAQRLGLQLMPANDPAESGQSLDFAISGARTGSGAGHRLGNALLGYGMRNQVDDFAARVRRHEIEFDAGTTLFIFAGGLNDGKLPTEETVANLEGEIKTIYSLGGLHFIVALLPTAIPDFSAVGARLDPALAGIPAELNAQLAGAQVNLSQWGSFYDEVMRHPAKYGITDTEDQCAGRAIFHQDSSPCVSPSTHFYYHHGHPSTAVHKIVGGMLYGEVMELEKQGRL
ncbi:MAG: SGNH/GDSL hydrolase family protein [Terracidiphilus sp.]